MKTSWNGNAFRIAGFFVKESTEKLENLSAMSTFLSDTYATNDVKSAIVVSFAKCI